jgi:hypothetical protein
MAGRNPGQVYHTIPSNWQQINGLAKILMVYPELKFWFYSQTKYAFVHPEHTLNAFVQEVVNYCDATALSIVQPRSSRSLVYANVGQTDNHDHYDESLEAYNAVVVNQHQGPRT